MCLITGGHTIYPPIEGLLPTTRIEPTPFRNLTSKVAGSQVHATTPGKVDIIFLWIYQSFQNSYSLKLLLPVAYESSYLPVLIWLKTLVERYFENNIVIMQSFTDVLYKACPEKFHRVQGKSYTFLVKHLRATASVPVQHTRSVQV